MDDRFCLLVIIGADETGKKELMALSDGYRESAASWEETLLDLTQRGLAIPPKLAVGEVHWVSGTPWAKPGLRLLNNGVGCIRPPM